MIPEIVTNVIQGVTVIGVTAVIAWSRQQEKRIDQAFYALFGADGKDGLSGDMKQHKAWKEAFTQRYQEDQAARDQRTRDLIEAALPRVPRTPIDGDEVRYIGRCIHWNRNVIMRLADHVGILKDLPDPPERGAR